MYKKYRNLEIFRVLQDFVHLGNEITPYPVVSSALLSSLSFSWYRQKLFFYNFNNTELWGQNASAKRSLYFDKSSNRNPLTKSILDKVLKKFNKKVMPRNIVFKLFS